MFVAGESHAKSGRSDPNADGSRWKPPVRSVVSLKACLSSLKPGESAHFWPIIASSTHDAHPFYRSAWRTNRLDHHFNSPWCRPGREQRRARSRSVCARRDKDGWNCLLQDVRRRGATKAGSHCHRWAGRPARRRLGSFYRDATPALYRAETAECCSMPFPIASGKRSVRNELGSGTAGKERGGLAPFGGREPPHTTSAIRDRDSQPRRR